MMQDRSYDKTRWGHGEWDKEPDRVDFVHVGFACFILRNPMGVWCGYVGVDKTHPHYGADYEGIDVTAHGGLTYASKCDGDICHVPEPGMPDDVWWFGFDCAHADDYVPSMGQLSMMSRYGTYKNQGYAIAETKRLAEQLAELR
jgi:hypothetical protein